MTSDLMYQFDFLVNNEIGFLCLLHIIFFLIVSLMLHDHFRNVPLILIIRSHTYDQLICMNFQNFI